MSERFVEKILARAIAELGERRVCEELERILDTSNLSSADVLTIVVNVGVHHLPKNIQRGEVYIASEGSLDFSSKESAHDEFLNVLQRVASKLKQKNWKKIYLVPFGPAHLSMLVKLLVYRVTHIETVDVFHMGGGVYEDMDVSLRLIAVEAK